MTVFFWTHCLALQVEEPKVIQRVISLSPAITEIIYELKLEKTLVGTVEFSDFPEEAKKIPRVGSYAKPSIEKILSFKPDVVFIPKEGVDQISYRMKQLKINYEVFEINKLSQVGLVAKKIAQILKNKEAGEAFAKNWDKKIEFYSKSHTQKKAKSLIVLQTDPLIVAANNTFLNEMIELCGGINVYINLDGYPRIQQESFMSKKYGKVFLVEHFSEESAKGAALKRWAKTGAQIYLIPPDEATRPGPRLLIGIEKICHSMTE